MDKIKIAGHWKDIKTMYIKIVGEWKEISTTYLKQNGKWMNTSTLPWIYNITVVVKNAADVSKITHEDTSGNVIRTVSGKEINFKSKKIIDKKILIEDLAGDSISAVKGIAYSAQNMMHNWRKITTPPDLSGLDTSEVTNMRGMMEYWREITTPPDLSGFDTSKVTSMWGMMDNWMSLKTPPDLSGFNTENVEDLGAFMYAANKMTTPPDLSNFDTSKVTTMWGMMHGWNTITTPPDLSSFDTSKVTDMNKMMDHWSALTNPLGVDFGVKDFNIESLTTAEDIFTNTKVSTALYDAILTKWSAQNFKHNVKLGMGTAKYSNTSAIIACRKKLTDAGWQITDGGHT